MTQDTRQTPTRARRSPTRAGTQATALMQAKMALVAAREQGEPNALAQALTSYGRFASELTEFSAALTATAGYEREQLTPASDAAANRARERAFAAVFPTSAQTSLVNAGQRALTSLKALRKAANLTPRAVATRLGIGVDVLSKIESGGVETASVPERFVRALGDALGVSFDQTLHTLRTQQPAMAGLQRNTTAGATKAAQEEPVLDFAELIRLSASMTPEQKTRWLEE